MTKEEAIEQMIKEYKDGIQMAFTNFCIAHTCAECPFVNGCRDAVFNELIERLVKAEESQKAETNLEHYTKETGLVALEKDDYIEVSFAVDKKAKKELMESGIRDWLLSPYEEPKPTYKLSKFEYDLLKYFGDSKYGIRDFWILEHMQDKSYFKGIPTDVPIETILNNCEVD